MTGGEAEPAVAHAGQDIAFRVHGVLGGLPLSSYIDPCITLSVSVCRMMAWQQAMHVCGGKDVPADGGGAFCTSGPTVHRFTHLALLSLPLTTDPNKCARLVIRLLLFPHADRNVTAGMLEVWVSYLGFNVYSK